MVACCELRCCANWCSTLGMLWLFLIPLSRTAVMPTVTYSMHNLLPNTEFPVIPFCPLHSHLILQQNMLNHKVMIEPAHLPRVISPSIMNLIMRSICWLHRHWTPCARLCRYGQRGGSSNGWVSKSLGSWNQRNKETYRQLLPILPSGCRFRQRCLCFLEPWWRTLSAHQIPTTVTVSGSAEGWKSRGVDKLVRYTWGPPQVRCRPCKMHILSVHETLVCSWQTCTSPSFLTAEFDSLLSEKCWWLYTAHVLNEHPELNEHVDIVVVYVGVTSSLRRNPRLRPLSS